MSKKVKCHPSYQGDDLIFKAVEAAKGFDGLTDANQYFLSLCKCNSEFVQLGNNVYRYKDYYVNVGKRFLMAEHGECLMSVSGLELSCLPQGIALVWLDNGEDMVLFTRIKGSDGRRLIPYSECPQASAEARTRLLSDAERLMEENYALLTLSESRDSWHILEGEDRVIISDCRLAFVSDAAKPAYRSRLVRILDLL